MCTGYGGIERGLELAGFEFRTILNVEIEAYCCTECGYVEEYVREPESVAWEKLPGFEWATDTGA